MTRPGRKLSPAEHASLCERLAKARAVQKERRERLKAASEAARPGDPLSVPERDEGFNIVTMVTSPKFLGDDTISVAQIAILKAIYGLRMTPEEMQEFLLMSEGRPPREGGYAETTIIAGRGGGKTEKILANVCVFEAITFDVAKLAPGEKAVVPLVAQDAKGATIALDYCEGKLRILKEHKWNVLTPVRTAITGPKSKDVVGGEIRVRENVAIRVYPCKKASTRGVSGIAAGMDEFAHWRTEPHAYNSDREIQRALKATRRSYSPFLRLVKITTPFGEEGVAWEDYEQRQSSRRLFLQAPTWTLNPALSRESLLEEELDDPDAFARERGAQFGKVGGNFLSSELVESCMPPAREKILPPVANVEYHAALDVAFKVDQYVVGIAHLDLRPCVVFDGLWVFQGSKKRPLDDAATAAEVADILKAYDLDLLIGDQFADVPTKREYQQHGIRFRMEAQTAQTNHQMFKNLKAALRRKQVELPPDPMVKKDLTGLVRSKLQGGLYRVAAPERAGCHDDISKVIAILTLKLLPIADKADLMKLNAGAIRGEAERRLHKPTDHDIVTGDIMGMVF